jgi:hypothetical protein
LKVKLQEDKRIHGIKLELHFFDAKQQVNALLNVNTVLMVVNRIMVYIALPILFGIFHGPKALLLPFWIYLNP